VRGANRGRVLFHKCSSVTWMVLLIPSWLWWNSSILWVITISIYANIKSDWAAAEASDDHKVREEINELKTMINELTTLIKEKG
jgi:hypothetical protein